MQSYLSVDGLRAILVLLLAIGQALMAFWPDIAKWPETTTSRSAKLRNPVVPIDWAFAIWGVIFLWVIAFAIWQVLPGNLDHPLAQRIGWVAAILFFGNILWEFHVPRRGFDRLSVAIIVIELALLLWILLVITAGGRSLGSAEFWLVSAPFQLFAGWVSAAVFANIATTLQRAGVTITPALSVVFIIAAAFLAGSVAWLTQGWIYTAAVVWALFGLVIANTIRERKPGLAIVAGAMIPLVIGSAALAV